MCWPQSSRRCRCRQAGANGSLSAPPSPGRSGHGVACRLALWRVLTRRGWAVACVSVVFALCGRLFDIPELFALAAAAATLVVVAAAFVRLNRFHLEATRELHPERVHAGSDSRVELSVRNASPRTRRARRSPVLAARDPFDGGRRSARFLLAPLVPGEVAHAAYRLPTDRRGVFDLGPLEIEITDPFGLAAARFDAAARTRLTVYPRIDVIEALPQSRGNDPYAGADHPTALGQAGEDFYALREYEEGDDLRRVHWAATAKLDELMIRQDEMPWQGRATVVVDLRRGVHTPVSLEIALSAAASIITSSWKRRSLVRLVTTDGLDSGFGAGAAHVEAVLERLAEAKLDRGAELTPVLGRLQRGGNGGAFAVVTTAAASSGDLESIARLRTRFPVVALVLIERSAFDPSSEAARVPPRAVPTIKTVVRVTSDLPFAAAWHDAIVPAVTGVRWGVRR